MSQTTGIILAGGKSSRMGQDKGLIKVNGKLMVEHVIDEVKKVVDEIIIIANNDEYEQLDYSVYKDLIEEKGPVAGTYTGLHYSQASTNVIVSCDVPKISSELLGYLLNQSSGYQVTVPLHQGKTHQLVGVYDKSCLPVFKNALKEDKLRLRDVNETLTLNKVEISSDLDFYNENLFTNINTPKELDANRS